MTYTATPGPLTDLFTPQLNPGEQLQGIFLCRERWASGFGGGGWSAMRASLGLRRYHYIAITDQRVLAMRVSALRGLKPGRVTHFPRESVECVRCEVRWNRYTLVDLRIKGQHGLWSLLAPAGESKVGLWRTLKGRSKLA
ncbi:MAG TPA: hypothetical protein VNA65_02100 [Candidatus Dormibacteraeota bacterium]|nr:hypothetical protein [Candidatus Dormibacteraeota bacterium]